MCHCYNNFTPKCNNDEDMKSSCLIYQQTRLRVNRFRYRYLRVSLSVSSCSYVEAHHGSATSYFSSCSLCSFIKAPHGFGTSYVLLLFIGKLMSQTSTPWRHNILRATALHREMDQEYRTSLCTVV